MRCAAEGSWPLWNPFFGFGAPLLADAGHQLAYPFTWLLFATTPWGYYKALALFHAALGGLGAFRLGRRYGLSEWPAFVAAALWSCSGPFLSLVAMNQHFVGAALMPWVLLAFEALLAAPTPRSALWLGASAALQLLAGSPDMCATAAIAGALRLLAHRFVAPGRPLAPRRLFATAALAGALALGLAAAQWLPAVSLVRGSGRAQMSADQRAFWSLSPAAAVDLLLPRFLSDAPLGARARELVYEAREPFLPCLYVGVLSGPLALIGAWSGRRFAVFAAAAALVFLALALGPATPLHAFASQLPPFQLMRYPVKHLVPFALFLSLLCGFGMEALRLATAPRRQLAAGALAALGAAAACGLGLFLLRGDLSPSIAFWLDPRLERRLLFQAEATQALLTAMLLSAGGFLLLCASRRYPRAAAPAAAALAALALGDSLRVAQSVNPTAPAALLRHRPKALDFVGEAQREQRIFAARSPQPWLAERLARGPAGWDAEARWSLGLSEALWPLRGALYGLRGSYDGDFTGLAPAAAAELAGLLARFRASEFGLRLLQLANVGYVVTLEPAAFPSLAAAAPPLPSVFSEPVRVLRVPDPLPAAYVVDGSRVAGEPASYLQLADPAFDPRREVVLAPPGPARSGAPGFAGSVAWLERRMDGVALEAELNGPGFLVLVEAFERGWRAEVDGVAVPVLRANVLFRAVALDAGRHRVSFAYRPPAAAIGLLLSLATLLVVLGLAAARAAGARRTGREPPGRGAP